MKDNTKIALITGIIIVVLLVAVFLMTLPKTKGSPLSATNNSIWPLSLGYQGEIVKDIQKKLNNIFHGADLVVDGKIGPATVKYLKQAGYYPLTEEGYQEITIMAG